MWDALKLYAKRSFLSYTEEHQPKDEKSTQLDEEVIDQNAQLKKNLRAELSNAWFLTSYCAQMSQKAESTLLKRPSKGTQKDIYDLKATPSSVPKLSITDIALIL